MQPKITYLSINTVQSTINNFIRWIQNNSSTVIDNTFLGISRTNLSAILPTVSGLSEHSVDILTIKKTWTVTQISLKNQIDRQWNNHEFSDWTKIKENCESVCVETNVSHMFNSIPCTFLNIFQAILPVTQDSMKGEVDSIAQGINISCEHTSSLHAFTKYSDDKKETPYIKYCEIQRNVTKKLRNKTSAVYSKI